MAIAITSIGTKVSYAFEATAGVRPTEGYKVIPQVKEIPELNPSPETLETTSFDNLKYKTYIDGLKDPGGTLDFLANLTQELYTMWQDPTTGVMKQWDTAKTGGKAMYLCIDIPGIKECCYISVIPSDLGLPSASVNTVLEITLHFTAEGEPEWAEEPKYATQTPSAS